MLCRLHTKQQTQCPSADKEAKTTRPVKVLGEFQ